MLQAVEPAIRLNPADDVAIARIQIPDGALPLKHNLAMGDF
jgi:hypothetical protein